MIRIALFGLLCLACSLPATAQYPDRPLTLLSVYAAGGMVDIVARLLAEGIRARFPKGIVVLNRSRAGGAAVDSAFHPEHFRGVSARRFGNFHAAQHARDLFDALRFIEHRHVAQYFSVGGRFVDQPLMIG